MRVTKSTSVPGAQSARAVNGRKNVVTSGSSSSPKAQLGSHGSGLRGPCKDSMYNSKGRKA